MARRFPATALSKTEFPPGNFRGRLIAPGSAEYESARRLWNGMVDRRPALIARCSDAADVAAAVDFGRERGMRIAVRGGGHNVAGNAMCDGGLVIDLSSMRRCAVDVERRLVRVEGGALLGDLDAATRAYGLAVPVGIDSTTGIGGLALGGGIGHLMRRHGLTVDNLVEAMLVTASGDRVRAAEDENPGLFWGIRGGGGNFGVATSLTFRLHPVVPEFLSGVILYRGDRARGVMRFYREFVGDAPDELGTILILRKAPPAPFLPAALHGAPIVAIVPCYCGNPEDGEKVLRPLREMQPEQYLIGPMRFADFQGLLEPTVPPGWHYCWKSHYLPALSDGAIDVLADKAWRAASPGSYTMVTQMGGAVSRVPEDATAFAGRDAAFAVSINGAWNAQDAARADDTAWARDFHDALGPHATGRVYVNFIGDEGRDRVRTAYGEEKYARLAKLKAVWDPENLFRLNQNIVPAGG